MAPDTSRFGLVHVVLTKTKERDKEFDGIEAASYIFNNKTAIKEWIYSGEIV